MPLYEYRCPACGERFEWLQAAGAGKRSVACPQCGGRKAERQLSTFATASSGSSSAIGGESSMSCDRPQCGGGTCAGAASGWD